MDKILNQDLSVLGFGTRKKTVYLTLLEAGRLTPAELATRTGLKRPTVYGLLSELEEEGLIAKTFDRGRQVYLPENPEVLKTIFARREEQLDNLLPFLQISWRKNYPRPRVRYYEGVEGLRRVHEELLTTQSGEYFYFGSMQAFAESMGSDYLKSFIRRRIQRKIWSNAIRIRGQEVEGEENEGGPHNFRRLRYLRRDWPGPVATFTLFDGKIAVCSTTREAYAMVIESRDMYAILKLVWDCLWDASGEVPECQKK